MTYTQPPKPPSDITEEQELIAQAVRNANSPQKLKQALHRLSELYIKWMKKNGS